MKLSTIWTLPGMALKERLSRTHDALAISIAIHLPLRVKYWSFILVGAKAMPDDQNVPEAKFMDLLKSAEGGPR